MAKNGQHFVNHIELELRNIACFHEKRISLESGTVTEITGGNGRGKTTALLGLRSTTSGKKISFPPGLVTDGENSGTITANIDGALTVQRELKSDETGSTLDVRNSFGDGQKKPLDIIREYCGDGAYLNPMELVAMKPEQRVIAIATALDIDPQAAADGLKRITRRDWKITSREQIFSVIQEADTAFREKRKETRKAAESADSKIEATKDFVPAEWLDAKGEVPAPVEPPPLGDVYDRKRAAEVRNGERTQLAKTIADQEEYLRKFENQIDGNTETLNSLDSQLASMGEIEDTAAIEAEIRRLTEKLASIRTKQAERENVARQAVNLRESITLHRDQLTTFNAKLAANKAREKELGGVEDISALQAQIDQHEDKMTEWREALKVHGERSVRYQQIADYFEEARQLWAEWDVLQDQVEDIGKLPTTLLDGLKLPIPGMQIFDGDIWLPDGESLRRFDGFGDADKLKFATRFAMELAPVNILMIDGVEKCDEDRRMELYRMCAEADFITLTTCVTKGPFTVTVAARKGETTGGPDWNALTGGVDAEEESFPDPATLFG